MEQRTSLNLDAWPTPADYYYNIREGELPSCHPSVHAFTSGFGCLFVCFSDNHPSIICFHQAVREACIVLPICINKSCIAHIQYMTEA